MSRNRDNVDVELQTELPLTDALCKRGFTRSLAVPTTTLLASRLSNTSSVLSWPAAPGRGGKLERPNSKLGDGGLGGGGGD